MRKFTIAAVMLLAAAAVLCAGCVSDQPAPAPVEDVPVQVQAAAEASSDDAVLTILVEKEGTVYNTEDSIVYYLPSTPSTGYDWEIACSTDAVKFTKEFLQIDEIMPGASGMTKITVTALKEGDADYIFKYMRSWETDKPALYTVSDGIIIQNVLKRVENPRCTFVYNGTPNPAAGEKVRILLEGIQDGAYGWNADSEYLKVSNNGEKTAENISCTEFFVTAESAGTYNITFTYADPRENAIPKKKVELTLKFV